MEGLKGPYIRDGWLIDPLLNGQKPASIAVVRTNNTSQIIYRWVVRDQLLTVNATVPPVIARHAHKPCFRVRNGQVITDVSSIVIDGGPRTAIASAPSGLDGELYLVRQVQRKLQKLIALK